MPRSRPEVVLGLKVRELERRVAALEAGLKALGGKPVRPRRCSWKRPVCIGMAVRGHCTCVP